jgi:hypothetical protein
LPIERAPIVNGIVEVVKMGEMAASVYALTGRFTSSRGACAPPSGELPARVRGFYGSQAYPGAEYRPLTPLAMPENRNDFEHDPHRADCTCAHASR